MNEDLFEVVKDKVGCEFISDMRYGKCNAKARKALNSLDLSNYNSWVLQDINSYLYSSDSR